MQVKEKINVVWLKKDLRLRDHPPLAAAASDHLPVLILFCFEPSLMTATESDVRHWRFIYESLRDLETSLSKKGKQLCYTYGEVIQTLDLIADRYDLHNLYAHQEVGIKLTFDRDKAVMMWCDR